MVGLRRDRRGLVLVPSAELQGCLLQVDDLSFLLDTEPEWRHALLGTVTLLDCSAFLSRVCFMVAVSVSHRPVGGPAWYWTLEVKPCDTRAQVVKLSLPSLHTELTIDVILAH